jgi:hypothetical protein
MPTNPTTEASDAGWRLDLVSKGNERTGYTMLGAILPSDAYVSTLQIIAKALSNSWNWGVVFYSRFSV